MIGGSAPFGPAFAGRKNAQIDIDFTAWKVRTLTKNLHGLHAILHAAANKAA